VVKLDAIIATSRWFKFGASGFHLMGLGLSLLPIGIMKAYNVYNLSIAFLSYLLAASFLFFLLIKLLGFFLNDDCMGQKVVRLAFIETL